MDNSVRIIRSYQKRDYQERYAFYEEENKKDVLEQADKVRNTLNELKNLRARCSDYSQTQPLEDEFVNALRLLSSMLIEEENE